MGYYSKSHLKLTSAIDKYYTHPERISHLPEFSIFLREEVPSPLR